MTLGMAMIIFRYDNKVQSIQERMVRWTSLLKTKQTHIHSLTHTKKHKNFYFGKIIVKSIRSQATHWEKISVEKNHN